MAGKRRSSLDGAQIAFTFDLPPPAHAEGDLAGLDRFIAAVVGRILKEDDRSREEIAGRMSSLLLEPVTKLMLDAYASEARDHHNVSAARLFTLIAATGRFDLLDATTRRIGAAVLVGEEIHAARLGHLRARRAEIDTEIKAAERAAKPIVRGE